MAQPRYNEILQTFLHNWMPNDQALNERFVADVRALVAAIVTPPGDAFEVTTLLSRDGGKVVCRLGDYEVQLQPVGAHHLALSLIEAAASARIESYLFQFISNEINLPKDAAANMIGAFRQYRVEELEKELAGDLAKQGKLPNAR